MTSHPRFPLSVSMSHQVTSRDVSQRVLHSAGGFRFFLKKPNLAVWLKVCHVFVVKCAVSTSRVTLNRSSISKV